jgi:hypothetical protein
MGIVRTIALVLPVLLAATDLEAGPTDKDRLREALRSVEGRVVALDSARGEGSLPLVAATLESEGATRETVRILLAPVATLEAIGFAIERGDRLRAKLFVAEQGPAPVHAVENVTRGTEARLRTLHRVPLWDGRGTWQGGPSSGHRHGRGGH